MREPTALAEGIIAAPEVVGMAERCVRRSRARRLGSSGLAAALLAWMPVARATTVAVQPTVETAAYPTGTGDVADDVAIWLNEQDPASSVVIGDNKSVDGGLGVFDLAGALLQYTAIGKVGNVDLRPGFVVNGVPTTVVGANILSSSSIILYALDPSTRTISPIHARTIGTIPNYGFCMYHSHSTGIFYAFVTSWDGRMEQHELFESGGKVDARLVRSFDVGGTTETCVADDEQGDLYVGEEDVGLWKYGAEPTDGSARTLVDAAGAGRLVADVEGIAIAYGPGSTGFVIVSSQGNSTLVVYERSGANAFVETVSVGASGSIDRTSNTDGVDVLNASMGTSFPRGLLVVHDHNNTGGTTSNYKYIPLERVLTMDPPDGGAGDVTGPTVSLDSPSSGASVSGTTVVDASASDDVAVTKVAFSVDGTLQSDDFDPPYAFAWDTTSVENGLHSLSAKAYDEAGNVGDSTPVSVTVSNGCGGVATFTATADARVSSAKPGVNYGTAVTLQIRGSTSPYVESYVKYEVSGVGCRPQSVSLLLYVSDPGRSSGSVFSTSSTWSETALTWNTKPPATSETLATLGGVSAGTWAVYDVTPAVTGDGAYSFVITSTTRDSVYFHSRENTNKPQLVVSW